MALQTGTNAPAFSLKHKHSEGLDDISLESGTKTVLLFFLSLSLASAWKKCTIRDTLSIMKDSAPRFMESVSIVLLPWRSWLSRKINFKLLSDFNRDASKAYDVLDDNFVPAKLGFMVTKRSAFVIGEDGVITSSWSSDNPETCLFDEIKAALADLLQQMLLR